MCVYRQCRELDNLCYYKKLKHTHAQLVYVYTYTLQCACSSVHVHPLFSPADDVLVAAYNRGLDVSRMVAEPSDVESLFQRANHVHTVQRGWGEEKRGRERGGDREREREGQGEGERRRERERETDQEGEIERKRGRGRDDACHTYKLPASAANLHSLPDLSVLSDFIMNPR